MLALLAAFLWACYSILTRKICEFGCHTILALFLFDFRLDLGHFVNLSCLLNILFLVPVITVTASVLILHEPFTWMTAAETLLTLAGLFLSQSRQFVKKPH